MEKQHRTNADNIQYRMYNCSYRAKRDGDGKMIIQGTAAVYDVYTDMGYYLEVIRSGFFTSDMRTDRCFCLKNHDVNQILGRVANKSLTLTISQEGLEYESVLPDTTNAKDVYTEIEGGYISQSSFAFVPRKSSWSLIDRSMLEGKVDKDLLDKYSYDGKVTVREYIECKELIDVSPVTYPAYDQTSTSIGKRDMDAIRREYEAYLAEQKQREAKSDESLQLRLRLAEQRMKFWNYAGV